MIVNPLATVFGNVVPNLPFAPPPFFLVSAWAFGFMSISPARLIISRVFMRNILASGWPPPQVSGDRAMPWGPRFAACDARETRRPESSGTLDLGPDARAEIIDASGVIGARRGNRATAPSRK